MRGTKSTQLRKLAEEHTKGWPEVRYEEDQRGVRRLVDCTRRVYKDLKKGYKL